MGADWFLKWAQIQIINFIKMKLFKYPVFLLMLLQLTACGNALKNNSQINWELWSFNKPNENPIIKADSSRKFFDPVKRDTVKWQKADVFNPGAIVRNGKVYLFTRCEDNPAAIIGGRTSRIGLAESEDGIHFTQFDNPVLYPDNDLYRKYDYPGGCEDPRVVELNDSTYVMAYTSWNYKVPRLSIAFSRDLHVWEKKGPAFRKAYNARFLDIASKSASIVTKMKNGRPVVAQINHKYWMYWGEKFVNLAWSENLIDWYPLLDENGNLKKIMEPRSGFFDSDLTECGPPALIADKGILLLYNGKNATENKADQKLPQGTYSVGWVLFDLNNPEKIIERTDTCILKPTLPHELTGQYQAGTTFAEGLVYFKEKWFLYYGTADSFIGVAVSN